MLPVIFPQLPKGSLADFRSKVMHKEEMREATISENCTSFCYMISSENTFDSEYARECRGIVFDSINGGVIGRPLHKFFNVNERPTTLVENLDWSKVARVMDKMDGSMIHTVITPSGIKLKSKKSFNSDVAVAAQKYADSHQNITAFLEECRTFNCTAIFEYVAPDARIVLFYPEPKLVLLHIRDNTSGEYMHVHLLQQIADNFGIELVQHPAIAGIPEGVNLGEHLLQLAKTVEGIEGWIVQFSNGEMVKLKTDWYLKRHRAMTFLRERDIAVLTLDEGLDDLKALLVGEGADISEILEIEQDVVDQVRKIHAVLFQAVHEFRHLERKDFAIKFKDDPYFGLIMQQYLGKTPAIKEWFTRNILKDRYTLRQINVVQSVAEPE